MCICVLKKMSKIVHNHTIHHSYNMEIINTPIKCRMNT